MFIGHFNFIEASAGVRIGRGSQITNYVSIVSHSTHRAVRVAAALSGIDSPAFDGAVVRLQSTEGAPRQVRRAWELPTEIDAAASSAKLENGVLTLTLAKRIPAPTATRLAID